MEVAVGSEWADRVKTRAHISRCKALEVAQKIVEDCHIYDDDKRDLPGEVAEVIVVAKAFLRGFLEQEPSGPEEKVDGKPPLTENDVRRIIEEERAEEHRRYLRGARTSP